MALNGHFLINLVHLVPFLLLAGVCYKEELFLLFIYTNPQMITLFHVLYLFTIERSDDPDLASESPVSPG